jgi:uncharacterized membrane protein YbhN (UPF0104 family)
LLRFDRVWLAAGVTVYLASIALRCVRWGILLRCNGEVKWRHVVEALLAGYAANYLLPGRIDELFHAYYAMRLFHMSHFTSLGIVIVERVCDGVILVCALWTCLALFAFESADKIAHPPWAIAAGITASAALGSALTFVLVAGRLDLRKLKLPNLILDRWKKADRQRFVGGTATRNEVVARLQEEGHLGAARAHTISLMRGGFAQFSLGSARFSVSVDECRIMADKDTGPLMSHDATEVVIARQ